MVNNLVSRGMVLKLVVVLAMTQSCLSYATTPSGGSQRYTVAPTPLPWHSLELHDSGVAASVTTRIDLRKLSAADVRATLVEVPKPMSPTAVSSRIVEIEIDSMAHLLLGAGIETRNRLWFNEDDGLPLQLTRIRQGRNPSSKLYRFGSNRVYRLSKKPDNKAETGQPPEHWSQISESFYPLPGADGECPSVLESSQLFYLLSSPHYEISETPAELCVFSRQHVYRLGVRIMGREQLDVDYLQVTAGQETRIRRTMEVLNVALTSRPVEDTSGGVEPFSFLGLQGEIHLLLSDPGRVPLRVRGQVPGFGDIDLELKKLTR